MVVAWHNPLYRCANHNEVNYMDIDTEMVKKRSERCLRGMAGMILMAVCAAIFIPVAQADTVTDTCKRIASKLASVKLQECLDSKLTDSGNRSVEKIPLLVKEYPPMGDRIPEARVLVLGGIHGDEYSSVSIVFKWMQTLDKYHSGLFHWIVAPLVNPDGLLRSNSRRTNANGVDLNRNFLPLGPYESSMEYWKTRARMDPRRYPGPNPWSEPEALWVTRMIYEFDPDVIVSVHAPFGIVDFDGPHKGPEHLGPLYLNLLGTYPGSLGNYAGLRLDIPVVTIELPYAGIMPKPHETSRIWVDLVKWLKDERPPRGNRRTAKIAEDKTAQLMPGSVQLMPDRELRLRR